MIFLKSLKLNKEFDGYPFIPLIKKTNKFEFNSPITVICGGNGTGKSTFIKIISNLMNCYKLGEEDKNFNGMHRFFSAVKGISYPKDKFEFSAEVFIEYIKILSAMREEASENLEKIENDQSTSSMSKMYGSQPFASTLYSIDSMYRRKLNSVSHGEGFLEFFKSRIHDRGFYVLDEPEDALSYNNQYNLAYNIFDAAENRGCQFIIATHSPVFVFIPNADIYEIREDKLIKNIPSEIENIKFLKMFLAREGKGMFEK